MSVIRTLISLSEKDKRWLDTYSQRRGQSAAETVREAIRHLRNADAEQEKRDMLDRTSGIWAGRQETATDYVYRIRGEW
jgi:Arc/MetJ-type ribon-helix-helix transcriptional regulator